MTSVEGVARPAPRIARFPKAVLAAALAVSLGGCATNLTGFDFPMFGLTKKENSAVTPAPEQMHTSRLGEP